MTISENLFESLRMELRRGSLTLAVLAQLRQERYGYTLRKALAERGMEIDESTLYPLLRRLEAVAGRVAWVTGAGSGSHDASASSTVITATVARTRGRASWRVAAPIAKARSRRVPRILPVAGSVTASKATAFHDGVVDQLA